MIAKWNSLPSWMRYAVMGIGLLVIVLFIGDITGLIETDNGVSGGAGSDK